MAALSFSDPPPTNGSAPHHRAAAQANVAVTSEAMEALTAALRGTTDVKRILLKAAAGAGKSFALTRMVDEALRLPECTRVAVSAFANKQIFPLAAGLGRSLGRDRVCLLVSDDHFADAAAEVSGSATVVTKAQQVPADVAVVVATSHMLGYTWRRMAQSLGTVRGGEEAFDVLFIDEAWQLPLHRYRAIDRSAAVHVGVGDVGQLPPIDPGQNPWRGDSEYNPYRAWPTQYDGDAETWSRELPAVWRPTEAQLPLWRSFYSEWASLTCVAAAGDRRIGLGRVRGDAAPIWRQVATGVPTLVEVDGLPEPDAPDVDPPLLDRIERWLDALLDAGFELREATYDEAGAPNGERTTRSDDPGDRTLIALLATRNQAVDDAVEVIERLKAKHGLPDGALVASTVDSWQGQTNAITVAVHPLSGAAALDEFNSAFGRLAVTCTRATHGLLMASRAGLDELLRTAPPRPGTPLGEPGVRQLPRQTHARILNTFARATIEA